MERIWIQHPTPIYLLAFVLLTVAWGVTSCRTAERTLLAPPQIAGASYVGSDECADCHEDKTSTFRTATHSWIEGSGPNAVDIGCESCHGAGSVHVESGGAFQTIVNPGQSPETCFGCHVDKESEFSLQNRHPVLEGQVTCADCHNPHAGDVVNAGLGTLTQNDTCFQCHSAQKGPFTFEHEALREGCTTCHSPHGSVNAKMLKARNADLCLQCHAQAQVPEPGEPLDEILMGDRNHASFLPRGTCWSAGCHEAIHGSNVSERLRY